MSTTVADFGQGPALHDEPVPITAPNRWRSWAASAQAVGGGVIVALIALVALVSLVWTPYPPLAVHPSHALAGPSAAHWLGTDQYGRDVLSRLMVGSQITLYAGAVSVLIATVVGVPVGVFAALRGGAAEEVVLRLADIVYAFPALLAAITLSAALGASTVTAMVAIGIAYIPVFVRVTRANAIRVLRSEYVLAARSYGRRPWAVVRRHVLPNIRPTIVVQMTQLFSLAILAEAALDFLGLGTTPPTPSWGNMLQTAQDYLSRQPLLSVFPGVAIFLAVLAFNLLGDGLNDVLEPRWQR
jgi:peptide/nickel transport system permease protein